MGILNSLEAEIEKLNPANIVSAVEEARETLSQFETRLVQLESSLTSVVRVAQQAAPLIEAACPQATPDITAVLTALKNLTVPATPPQT